MFNLGEKNVYKSHLEFRTKHYPTLDYNPQFINGILL